MRLSRLFPDAEHLHRPPQFGSTVQARFQSGRRLLLICASGIAVRTLAPVLTNKRQEPAVLVLDEAGQFVIPLISGHEGGANAWGQEVADLLEASCVVTGVRSYTTPVVVAGLGCVRGCCKSTLGTLLEEALQCKTLRVEQLSAIASIDLKHNEPGLLALASALGVPCAFYSVTELVRYDDRLSVRSQAVYRETGCYGVAEAAALAHVERLTDGPAELLLPKRKTAEATVALALGYCDQE
jgi:cobalt-precorrin 5A hydrolase